MRRSFFLSVHFALAPCITAYIAHRQAAGSVPTSAIPSSILTAGPESVTVTPSLPSGTAFSELPSTPTVYTPDAASATPTPTKSLEPCNNAGGQFAPFCQPTNGSSLTADKTSYVTWDSSFFSSDAFVVIEVSYANSSAKSGTSVYSTGQIDNSVGWAAVNTKSTWLQGQPRGNITFHIARMTTNADADNSATIIDGPTVILTSEGSSSDSSNAPLDTSSSSKSYAHLGIVVGLTIGVSFLLLLLVSGLFVSYRRYQRKNRVYGVAKSRSQRLDHPRHRSWHGQAMTETHRQGMIMA